MALEVVERPTQKCLNSVAVVTQMSSGMQSKTLRSCRIDNFGVLEVEPYVPFWLKAQFCESHKWGMSLVVAAEPDSGEFPQELAFGIAAIWAFGLCCGVILSQGLRCVRFTWTTAPKPSLLNWQRIVNRALHFVRRRRVIALAFNNYKNHPIGRAPKANPSARRRAGTPGPKARAGILHEGPAFSHGPN